MATSSDSRNADGGSGRRSYRIASIEDYDPTEPGCIRPPRTGEMWTLIFQCKIPGRTVDDFVTATVDKADVTLSTIISFKEQLGFTGRDYVYYKKRSGLDVASLQVIDLRKHALQMVEDLAAEKEVRLVLSKEEQQQKNVNITPVKRPLEKEPEEDDDDDLGSYDALDAYKDWLEENMEDESLSHLRDIYREETIAAYTEWLKKQGELDAITAYENSISKYNDIPAEDDSQETIESKGSSTTPPNQWPSHARYNKDKKAFKKRGRGTLKGLVATRKRLIQRTHKLKVEFSTNLGGPCGENARTFVDEVVTFTRLHTPLIGIQRWKDVPRLVRLTIVRAILDGWDIANNNETKDMILKIAKERYKGWRSSLSATYRAYEDYDSRMSHKPEDLDIVEWHYLIKYFGSKKFKKVSSQNSSNRKQRKCKHVSGSKPFSQCSWEQRDENGVEPGPSELWKATHYKHEKWSDEVSEAVYNDALKRLGREESQELLEGQTEISKVTISEEELALQAAYRETTGLKQNKLVGGGYLSKNPTKSQQLQDKLERQAREVDRLKEQLAKQAADREAAKEELKNSLREELMKEFHYMFKEDRVLSVLQKTPPTTNNETESAPTANEDTHDATAAAATEDVNNEIAPQRHTEETLGQTATATNIAAPAPQPAAEPAQPAAKLPADPAAKLAAKLPEEPVAKLTEEPVAKPAAEPEAQPAAKPAANVAPTAQIKDTLAQKTSTVKLQKENRPPLRNGKVPKGRKRQQPNNDCGNVPPTYITSHELVNGAKTRASSKLKDQDNQAGLGL